MIFESWDVVVFPFPFTERPDTKRRPALVLSSTAFNEHGQTILAMITTTALRSWPGDTTIEDPGSVGLTMPCMVRLKNFTLDSRLIVKKIGRLPSTDRRRVAEQLLRYLHPTP